MAIIEASPKEFEPQESKQYTMVFLEGLYGPRDEQGRQTPGKKLAIFVNREATHVVFLDQTFPEDFDTKKFNPSTLILRELQIMPQVHEINPRTIAKEQPAGLPKLTPLQIVRAGKNTIQNSPDYAMFDAAGKKIATRNFIESVYSFSTPKTRR